MAEPNNETVLIPLDGGMSATSGIPLTTSKEKMEAYDRAEGLVNTLSSPAPTASNPWNNTMEPTPENSLTYDLDLPAPAPRRG